MKTFGMALDLIDDPDVISEYCEYHRNVWPDVIEGLSLIGINEMKIFLGGNRLFMYIETTMPAKMRGHASFNNNFAFIILKDKYGNFSIFQR